MFDTFFVYSTLWILNYKIGLITNTSSNLLVIQL